MKNGKAFAIAGVSLAVLVGLYLVLRPKNVAAQPSGDGAITPVGGDYQGGCPPTFVRCPSTNTGPMIKANTPVKCYNPFLVDSRGLYPNGTDPCAPTDSVPDFDYSYFDISSQNPGADDTIYG